ncbi:MAG: hypothetical protein QOF41_3058 [Methylobacteriaceae bacterium]|nr:hypothetical protein [Methylobacteriaceae bacterium]
MMTRTGHPKRRHTRSQGVGDHIAMNELSSTATGTRFSSPASPARKLMLRSEAFTSWNTVGFIAHTLKSPAKRAGLHFAAPLRTCLQHASGSEVFLAGGSLELRAVYRTMVLMSRTAFRDRTPRATNRPSPRDASAGRRCRRRKSLRDLRADGDEPRSWMAGTSGPNSSPARRRIARTQAARCRPKPDAYTATRGNQPAVARLTFGSTAPISGERQSWR